MLSNRGLVVTPPAENPPGPTAGGQHAMAWHDDRKRVYARRRPPALPPRSLSGAARPGSDHQSPPAPRCTNPNALCELKPFLITHTPQRISGAIGHGGGSDGGPREAWDYGREIVSSVEAVLEFSEVARDMLAIDGTVGSCNGGLDGRGGRRPRPRPRRSPIPSAVLAHLNAGVRAAFGPDPVLAVQRAAWHCHVSRVWRPDRRPTRLTA